MNPPTDPSHNKRKVDAYLASQGSDESSSDFRPRRPPGRISETYSAPVHCNRPPHFEQGCTCCGRQPTFLCRHCNSVRYCSHEHAADDWDNHSQSCLPIKEAAESLIKTEIAIRAHGGDADTPAKAFYTSKGQFWKYKGLRPYLKARLELVNALRGIDTLVAVENALGHAAEILRFDPRDALCTRSIIPIFLLRLGKDELCYWFCKWWLTKGNDTHHDWTAHEPYFVLERRVDPLKTEDAFEHLDDYELTRTFTDRDEDRTRLQTPADLSLLVAIMLIKVRIHIDLQLLRNDPQPETYLQRHVSSVVAARYRRGTPYGFYMRTELELFEVLWEQVYILFREIRRVNRHFWPALLSSAPRRLKAIKRPPFSIGTETEAMITVQECYPAWHETPGAMAIIKKLCDIRF